MKILERFEDSSAAAELLRDIAGVAARLSPRKITLLEVCGTHTAAIARSGLRSLLPANVRLISGPGCPVCVTAPELIDAAIEVSEQPKTTLATFGDMVRVPGEGGSLETAKARGADIRIIYSPLEALSLAREIRDCRIVFFSIGFEATAPAVAWTLLQAKADTLDNLFIISANKLLPPALEKIARDPDVAVDGLICPGHVSAIIGTAAFIPVARDHHLPSVITGFEPVDILLAVSMLLHQIDEGRAAVEIEYTHAVKACGNRRAQEIVARVFERAPSAWRGFGLIAESGLGLRDAFAQFDALKEMGIEPMKLHSHAPDCLCAEIIRGRRTPGQCSLFGTACTPETPIGPCMISSEGACAAYFAYGVTDQEAIGNFIQPI